MEATVTSAPRWYAIDAVGDRFGEQFDAIVNALRSCDLASVERLAGDLIAVAHENRDQISAAEFNTAVGRAHSYLGEVASMRGDRVAFIEQFTAAISHLGKTQLVGALSRAHRGIAQAYLMLEMPALAVDHLKRATVLLPAIDREETRERAAFECDAMSGLAYVAMGWLNEADSHVRSAWAARKRILELTKDVWLPGLAMVAYGSFEAARGVAAGSDGRRAKGREALRSAVRHYDSARLDYWRAFARERLAAVLAHTDAAAAREAMVEARDIYAAVGSGHQARRADKWLRALERPPANVPALRADENMVTLAEGRRICVAGPATREAVESALRASCSASTVLIIGESGTGKEALARLVHERSARARGPFVAVNCASITKELMESDLFGHVKGAFTGAVANKIGKFEAAGKGTLFLDEIGEIPLELQAKLLRALEESSVQRIGENEWRKVDVRVVVATNRNLEEEVAAGRFRDDLYFRINVLQVHPRPLRDRRDEVPCLATYLARVEHNLEIDADAIEVLLGHDWPGNVRELRNAIARAANGALERGEQTITREIAAEQLLGATQTYRIARGSRAVVAETRPAVPAVVEVRPAVPAVAEVKPVAPPRPAAVTVAALERALAGTVLAGSARELAGSAMATTGPGGGPLKALACLARKDAPLDERVEAFGEASAAFGVKTALVVFGGADTGARVASVPEGIGSLSADWQLRAPLRDVLSEIKRYLILKALDENAYNLSATSRALGLAYSSSRRDRGLQALRYACRALDIDISPRAGTHPPDGEGES